MNPSPSPAVFLDRDGTLNEDPGYLIRFEDFRPLPDVVEALRLLQDLGFRLFVASNQSGVARGLFSLEDVEALNARIRDYFQARGVNLEEMAICPHHPEGSVEPYARECECRKPKPGMLLDLARRHHLDLPRSYMVGDRTRDAEAGLAAGTYGVRIGKKKERFRLDPGGRLMEFDSLLTFARTLRGMHAPIRT